MKQFGALAPGDLECGSFEDITRPLLAYAPTAILLVQKKMELSYF